MSNSWDALLEAIGSLVGEMPPAAVADIAGQLESAGEGRIPDSLAALGRTQSARAALTRIDAALGNESRPSGYTLGLALRAASRTADDLVRRQALDIAWTGPGTETVPMRRVDQVMYELIDAAANHVLLVTYAAYKADKVATALKRASERGVRIEMVVEISETSGGSLSFDSVDVLRDAIPEVRILWWPREKRTVTENGRRGSMHAKCLVVDRAVALVSSANLTDYALERNMELGLVIRGGDVPARLATHFQQLSVRGELVPVTIASKAS